MSKPTPNAAILADTVLEGAYRITRLMGEGGMGAVYEGIQLRLNKRVAIKLMARDLAANREALARFHREAEITSHLGHPHLVTVIDFGQAETGEPYLVMEYLEGEDLDHRLRREGRMPLEAVVRVVGQVASALGAAHDQGVVHRDLKPGNVFLVQIPAEPDFVKVLDFGISKMKAARTQLTSASAVMGTPNYMSPEQATGMVEDIDHRADQWALGCIAWEMLLGRCPFVADDVTALLYQIIHLDPQGLASRVSGVPAAVEAVLRRALRKQPAERFPSLREFAHAFEAAAAGMPEAKSSLSGTASGSGGHLLRGLARKWGRLGERSKDALQAMLGRVKPMVRSGVGRLRRMPPKHAVAVGAAVAALLAAILWASSISTRKPEITNTPRPVAEPLPTPSTPVITPVPTIPEAEPEPVQPKRSRHMEKTASDRKKPNPFAPQQFKPRTKRKLIEEL
jgi:eukaryotic-like serine/threonine-protein kinase